MSIGLRTRVTLAFGALAVLVALAVSFATYGLARVYLTEQRERSAVSRAQVDARFMEVEIADASVSERLETLPAVGDSQKLVRQNGTWYSSGASISPDDIPADLVAGAEDGQSVRQRFRVGATLYLGVAVPVRSGVYVEVFPLAELQSTLRLVRGILVASSALALVLGGVLGWFAASALLRPLRRLATGAGRMTSGDFSVRMGTTRDSDLEPIAAAFDEMADSVEQRIERERRFVANVSHELRTPVTVVLGSAELLEARSAEMPEDQRRLVELLSDQVGRLGRMVMDLLELGSLGAASSRVDFDRTDVAGLVEGILHAQGRDDVQVRRAGTEPSVISTDPRRLERIVANLIDNAETHGGGLQFIEIDGDATHVRVIVDDRGPGIPEEERSRVFEPFARGSGAAPGTGTGLGLAIVADQARALGAEIEVGLSPTAGGRMTVVVPRGRAG